MAVHHSQGLRSGAPACGARDVHVPLSHPPGHAQCDFGQAWATIGGERRRIHYFVMSLPHSDGIFVKAYPAETTEAFCDGHVSAFRFLGEECRRASCTTTRSLPSRRYWEEDVASARERSRSCSRTTCSQTGSALEWARATTRAVSRAWWDTADLPAGQQGAPGGEHGAYTR